MRSPTTAKLNYRNSNFLFLRRQEELYVHFKLHEWRNWKWSQQWSKRKKKTKVRAVWAVWNLPSQNSPWNRELILQGMLLRTSRAHNIQSTEARQPSVVSPFVVKKQSSSIIPEFVQYQPQLLQVPPFYYSLPFDNLVCNHYIPFIRDIHEIKLIYAQICIWINYSE